MVAAIIFLSSSQAFAGRNRSDWSVYANGGANIAWAKAGQAGFQLQETSGGPRFGLMFEGGVERRLTSDLSISLGLRYSQKGVETQVINFRRLQIDGELQLNYLEIPVHLLLRFPQRRWTPYIFGGFSYGISIKRQLNLQPFSFINPNIDARFNTNDFVLDAGLGGQVRLSPNNHFRVWVQYGHGLTDLDNNPTTFNSRTITVGAGFIHRL